MIKKQKKYGENLLILMKNSYKSIILLLLVTLYFISQWMVDIQSWARDTGSCTTNWFWATCDWNLWYHTYWYLSMIIFFVVSAWLLLEIKEKK